MLQDISLNGEWELRDEPLYFGSPKAQELSAKQEGWIPTPVPGDIHQGLLSAGIIQEPLLGLNSFECEWTEKRSWWYRKIFQVEPDWLHSERIELELSGLDSNAEIFLNGKPVASHHNTFRPCSIDLSTQLKPGENVLLVRLTAGVENISEADLYSLDGIQASGAGANRGDPRRVFVRKPQYTFGWDWSPRLTTTAIAGDVKLRMMDKACIRQLSLSPQELPQGIVLKATVVIDQFHYYKTKQGQLAITLTDEAGRQFSATQKVLLRSGQTYVDLSIQIPEPQLWWPNGMGLQHLYQVEAQLAVNGEIIKLPAFSYGLRFVELDTQEGFGFVINGKKVFCKGANWIPADAVYARVSDGKYDVLVREARDANFNMLRIWGGGWYEREAFYQACDRYGIMIWQDFMFACAPYPDHLDSFRIEVEREADYQTKRLRHHPSVVLWCGSNENHWGFRDWWDEDTQAGAQIYNYILPDVVQRNCPEIPYWNGSPYGGETPNSNAVGNHHHWREAMMNPCMEKRITPEEYDLCSAKFITEFGYVGACCKETTQKYLDGAPLNPQSEVWQHHTNTFEKDTVAAGIRKHYTEQEPLQIDDYLLYSALCQGTMLGYALESMRYRMDCSGALFWMFNDCWGEVGWTIIDYYLQRKPSWYYVRRAFAPLRMILRPIQDKISLVITNDSDQIASLEIEVGYLSLDGFYSDLELIQVTALPSAKTQAHVFGRGSHDPQRGLWVARTAGNLYLESAVFRAVDFKDLKVTKPKLECILMNSEGPKHTLRISAQSYAHAVHLKLPMGAVPEDNYFDLLPGESRDIKIHFSDSLNPDSIGISCVNERKSN